MQGVFKRNAEFEAAAFRTCRADRKTDEKIRTYRKIAQIHQDMIMVREITAKFAGILKDADNLTISGVLVPENARPGTYGTSSESALKTAGKPKSSFLRKRTGI